MPKSTEEKQYPSLRDKFLGLSLESTRKSYYPQLRSHLEIAKENARRLRLLTDNLPARISYVDAQECYVFVNRQYQMDFGLKREQIVGQRIESIIGPENYEKLKTYITDALCGRQVRFETVLSDSKKESRWFEVNYVPDIDCRGQVNGFYDLTRDLTEQKLAEREKVKLENQLQQACKMEAIGTLAGGIAHDFNNLLMGIQGRASLIMADITPSHPHHEHLSAIEEHIRSAANLTKQLLGFARGGKYEVKPIHLNELIQSTAAMFGRTKKEIRIHTQFQDPPWAVEADPSQIEQVLLNLFVNAWQAMPSGGDLFIETQHVELDSDYCKPHGVGAGRFVRVSVTDTGEGMDETTRLRIFEPFFTTKKKGRGTGMGLASAYGIIKNHNGIITVYTEKGHGTTFNIYLPFSTLTVRPEVKMAERTIRGSETILLVDDEDLIIDVGQAMLKSLGYRVITAKSGNEAIGLIEKMSSEIDLVILDLIMPDMDGGKAFDGIREILPNIKILLSSGYSLNGQAETIMRKGCDGFIQKPYSINILSNKIRGILDCRSQGF